MSQKKGNDKTCKNPKRDMCYYNSYSSLSKERKTMYTENQEKERYIVTDLEDHVATNPH